MFKLFKRKDRPSKAGDVTSLNAWEARAAREREAQAVKPGPVETTARQEPVVKYSCGMKREPREPREPGAKREHLNKGQVLEGLKQTPELLKASRIVGAWIWIDDDTFQDTPETRKALHDLGFRHNGTRQAWQNTCGKWFRRTDKPKAVIYAKYGQVPAAEYLGVETA